MLFNFKGPEAVRRLFGMDLCIQMVLKMCV